MSSSPPFPPPDCPPPLAVGSRQESRLEHELADEMTGHVLRGVPAETPPTHPPLALAKTAEGETPLMAAAGCPSPSCVELVSSKGRNGQAGQGKGTEHNAA